MHNVLKQYSPQALNDTKWLFSQDQQFTRVFKAQVWDGVWSKMKVVELQTSVLKTDNGPFLNDVTQSFITKMLTHYTKISQIHTPLLTLTIFFINKYLILVSISGSLVGQVLLDRKYKSDKSSQICSMTLKMCFS